MYFSESKVSAPLSAPVLVPAAVPILVPGVPHAGYLVRPIPLVPGSSLVLAGGVQVKKNVKIIMFLESF